MMTREYGLLVERGAQDIDAYARIVGGFLFSQFVLPCPPFLGFTWTIIVSIKISYISLAKFSFSTKLANIAQQIYIRFSHMYARQSW